MFVVDSSTGRKWWAVLYYCCVPEKKTAPHFSRRITDHFAQVPQEPEVRPRSPPRHDRQHDSTTPIVECEGQRHLPLLQQNTQMRPRTFAARPARMFCVSQVACLLLSTRYKKVAHNPAMPQSSLRAHHATTPPLPQQKPREKKKRKITRLRRL